MTENIKQINIPIAPEFLWFMLAIGILFFITVGGVLAYHWKKYGLENNPKVFAKTLFWTVSIALVFIMVLAIIGFENL
jgi:hypothetical protein